MAGVTFDASYTEQRNRLTAAFRIILAIPHLIVAQLWGYVVQILAVIQWFIILFTGKRNEGIFNFQRSWLEYYGRVGSYVWLIHDVFPPFGTEAGATPVRTTLENDAPVNRLTNALRIIWAIPAAIIFIVIGIGAAVVAVISWFAIVITGKDPQGMWDFMVKAVRYGLQLQAYTLLMTDAYPKFG
jgi:hypothetical protein